MVSRDKPAEASTEAAIAEDHPLNGVTPNLGRHAHTPKICYHNSTTSVCLGKEGG